VVVGTVHREVVIPQGRMGKKIQGEEVVIKGRVDRES
jgi:hypothetical protein